MPYILLLCSIILEVFGSTMLKLSNAFTKVLPVIGVVVGFGASFYVFSIVLLDLPLGFSYALWSGSGTILITLVGVIIFKEKINRQGVIGIVLLLTGIVLLNLG